MPEWGDVFAESYKSSLDRAQKGDALKRQFELEEEKMKAQNVLEELKIDVLNRQITEQETNNKALRDIAYNSGERDRLRDIATKHFQQQTVFESQLARITPEEAKLYGVHAQPIENFAKEYDALDFSKEAPGTYVTDSRSMAQVQAYKGFEFQARKANLDTDAFLTIMTEAGAIKRSPQKETVTPASPPGIGAKIASDWWKGGDKPYWGPIVNPAWAAKTAWNFMAGPFLGGIFEGGTEAKTKYSTDLESAKKEVNDLAPLLLRAEALSSRNLLIGSKFDPLRNRFLEVGSDLMKKQPDGSVLLDPTGLSDNAVTLFTDLIGTANSDAMKNELLRAEADFKANIVGKDASVIEEAKIKRDKLIDDITFKYGERARFITKKIK